MDNNVFITLAKIFKKGFTIEVNNGVINQYSKINKPFIVSYKTLIEIHNDTPIFSKHYKIPKRCIIGFWHDNKTGYIELNKAFKRMSEALIFAYKHKQKYIYNINNQTRIKVNDWENKIIK